MSEASQTWNIRQILQWTQGHFQKQAVDSPRLTAELLLAHALSGSRVQLYMELDRVLSQEERSAFRELVQRRAAGAPTAYLTGVKEFYKRSFLVNPKVLIPRPETELLVDFVLEQLPHPNALVADVCTGSGCIAASLAAERRHWRLWASDLDPQALEVARANAQSLGVGDRLELAQGDLLDATPRETLFDAVVSNPPYLPSDSLDSLQREVRAEPRLALDGGPDGFGLIRRLAQQAWTALKPSGWLVFEMAESHADLGPAWLQQLGYQQVRMHRDLAGLPRYTTGQKPAAAIPP